MECQTFSIADFIDVRRIERNDRPPQCVCSFDLTFARRPLTDEQRAAITGTCIYLISMDNEVIYLGSYRPMNGDIITDRWARHLQTITWRGASIGLGPASTEPSIEAIGRRRENLLAVIDHQGLQAVVKCAYAHDRDARFRSTGNDTSVNRTRFATKHWDSFSAATADTLLASFAFDLFRMHLPADQPTADAWIRNVERRLLDNIKPVCNSQYRVQMHAQAGRNNDLHAIVPEVIRVMREVTQHDPTHRIMLRSPLL